MATAMIIIFLFAFLHAFESSPIIEEEEQGQGNVIKHNDPYKVDLMESEECRHDVERICGRTLVKSNFDVIACLQTSFKDYDISDKCQNLIWNYKKNVTIDPKYETAVKEICSNMIQQISECQNLDQSKGHLISCLVEHMEDKSLQPLAHNCDSFLKRLKPVVFSDYRIIYKFSDACQNDIDRLHCGRVNEANDHQMAPYHSQGSVLTCLAFKVTELTPKCKFELLRVSELQGNDYHYDRQLFFACRNDREKFCGTVKSGEGRVYSCLVKHKSEPEMSEKCQESILLRQKLEQQDYKVNVKLSEACEEDITKNSCNKEMGSVAGFPAAKMSSIILCLESVQHDGGTIKSECMSELKDVRRNMIEDYRINPNVVLYCSNYIKDFCGGDIRQDGTTIHCLLKHSKPKMDKETNKFYHVLDENCRQSLHELILEADVVGDYEIDPVLHHTCVSVVRVYCAKVHIDEVYNCLTDSLNKPMMTTECSDSLNQIEYFKNRDIRMDPALYNECREDVKDICKAPVHWHAKGASAKESFFPMVLNCLYRHINKVEHSPGYKAISPSCAAEVRRVMTERAMSVNLSPEVETACMADLGKFCVTKNLKEEEMECLEDNWENLTEPCQQVIEQYVQQAEEEPDLNSYFLHHCELVMNKYCKEFLESKDMDKESSEEERGNLMTCLIENKNREDVSHECRTGLEHHQLITQKNIKFSPHLYSACETDAKIHCGAFTDKVHIVECLSEVRLNDTLMGVTQRLSLKCVDQLSFELTQRNENIKLDPGLEMACQKDIKYFCSHALHNNAATQECLTLHMEKLGSGCKEMMFRRIEIEASDPNTDYHLIKNCNYMIEKYCKEYSHSPEGVFSCLFKAKEERDFDERCRKVVVERAHLFGMDIRLNNELQKSCHNDVKKYCKTEMEYTQKFGKHEGLVIECLKSTFLLVSEDVRLEESCEDHIKDLIIMSSEDFQMDFSLQKHCSAEISNNCKDSIQGGYNFMDRNNAKLQKDSGRVSDCLKKLVISNTLTAQSNKKCFKQVKRLMKQSIVDIRADVTLNKACASDLKRFCDDVPMGEGKKLECLLVIRNNEQLKVRLTHKCSGMLESRLSMWKISFPDNELPISLSQVVDMVSKSPASNYLFLLILFLVFIIFVMGLCLGRITKRLKREIKDR